MDDLKMLLASYHKYLGLEYVDDGNPVRAVDLAKMVLDAFPRDSKIFLCSMDDKTRDEFIALIVKIRRALVQC